MKRSLLKMLTLALAMVLAFSFMAGCGGDGESNENTGSGVASQNKGSNSIVIATANETPTLAPHKHSAVAGGYMNILTHNTLFQTNIETLIPEPCLVEDYEILNDKQWELHLREGVKFHNGETMTAEDVKASMEYARENSSYTSTYSTFWESVEVVDELTLIVTTKEVYAKTLYDLASHYVLPKSLLDSGNDFNANPVGTGPYKFVKWTLGDSVEFEAFEDYWEGAPAIKKLTYRIIPEGSSRTIALEAGEIDFIVEVETNDLTRLEETEGITVINKTGTAFNFLAINNERAPFDNADFRHALNCAIDKEALVEVALNGAGTGVWVQTPPMFEGASDQNVDSYDLELAKQHLEASGIDPSTVEFSIICSDDVKRRSGEVIQANLKELGITVNLESMDLATYLSTVADGDFDAAIGGYTSTNMMSFIEGKFTTKSINGSNWNRYSDEHLDQLYVDATTDLDETSRVATLQEASAYLNEACPQPSMYLVNVVRAYNSDLQGIEVSASNTLRWQYVSWAE